MADIELVIKIPENKYKHIISQQLPYQQLPYGLSDMIKNGTPLPKGHGRLIDADKLQYEINNDKREAFSKHQVWLLLSIYNESVPTIMEADKTESEVKNYDFGRSN